MRKAIVLVFFVIAVFCWHAKAEAQIPLPEPNKNVAYIMIGNIEVNSWTEGFWQLLGYDDVRSWFDPLVNDMTQRLRNLGYHVRLVERVTAQQLRIALRDLRVAAIVWIGHGHSGGFSDFQGNTIGAPDIKKWSLEYLREKHIYKTQYEVHTHQEKMKMVEMERNAHFDLLYFYMWGCHTMAAPENSPASLMMRNRGIVEGNCGEYFVTKGYRHALWVEYAPNIRWKFTSNYPSVFSMSQTQVTVVPSITRKKFLDCLCRCGCIGCNMSCYYHPQPLKGSPSCLNPSNGECVCKGWGCRRFKLPPKGKCGEECKRCVEKCRAKYK